MTTRPAARLLAVPAALLALTLAACGTTDPAVEPEPTDGGGSPVSAEPITITDSRGEEVTLDAPAERVVTLEWAVSEYVLGLGVQPVGVADPEGYSQWVSSFPLDADVTDVGLRLEPSVEAIAGLEPDLILGVEGSVPEEAMAQMEQIAPVVIMNPATTDGLVELVKSNQTTVGELLGREAEAEALNVEFDADIAAAAAEIEAAGLEGTPTVLAFPFAEANSVTFRMHGPGSSPSVVANLIGLTDAWTEPGDEAYGLSSSDVEGLTALPDDTEFLYWVDGSGATDAVNVELPENAVWNQLPFVEAGRVHPGGDTIWLYGGTGSLAQLADDLVTQVTSD